MIVIAHRGNNKEALENTFAAYEKSVECGAQRIELDLHLSCDGEIFIFHDNDLTMQAFRPMKITESFANDISTVKLSDGSFIPRFVDVLEHFLPRIELNCELKGKSLALAQKAAEMVSATSLSDKVIFSSFEFEPISYLRDEFPDIQRACLVGDDRVQWPEFSHGIPVVFMHETSTKNFHPRADMVDENMMDYARNNSWKVFPWVPMLGEENDRERLWTILQSLNVHGLCTNYPRELILWLEANKKINLKDIHL